MGTLVVHPGPLGDVLLAIPALRALTAQFPEDPLVLGAQPGVGALLVALGAVDRALSFDALRLHTLFVEGEAAPLEALRSAGRVVCWFGGRDPVFTRRLRELVPSAIVASPTGDGAAEVWRHLLATVGASAPVSPPACAPSAEARQAGTNALARAGCPRGRRLLIAHPGAGGRGKRWPAEGFVRILAPLCRRPDLTVALHEGPADADAVAAVASQLGEGVRRLTDLPLVELAGALAAADTYLGNDSGVSHLAAAVGVPSVVLFERRRAAWRPWSASADIVLIEPGSLAEADVVADRLARCLAGAPA